MYKFKACSYGSDCKKSNCGYNHTICRNFKEGCCSRGKACGFLHEYPDSRSNSPQSINTNFSSRSNSPHSPQFFSQNFVSPRKYSFGTKSSSFDSMNEDNSINSLCSIPTDNAWIPVKLVGERWNKLSPEEEKERCSKVHNGINSWAKSNYSFSEKLEQYNNNHDKYTTGQYSVLNRGKVITSLAENSHLSVNVQMLEYLFIHYNKLYSYYNIKIDSPTSEFSFRPINLALWFGGRKVSQIDFSNIEITLKKAIDILLNLGYGFNLYGETETFLGPLINPENKLPQNIKNKLYDYILNECKNVNWKKEFGLTLQNINLKGYCKYLFLACILKNSEDSFRLIYDEIERSFVFQIDEIDLTKKTTETIITLLMKFGCSHYYYVDGNQIYHESEFTKFFVNSNGIDNLSEKFYKFFIEYHNNRIIERKNTDSAEIEIQQLVLMKLYYLGYSLKLEKNNMIEIGLEGERSELMNNIINEIKSTISFNVSVIMNDKLGEKNIPGIVYLLKTSDIRFLDSDCDIDFEITNHIIEELKNYRTTVGNIQFDTRIKIFNKGLISYSSGKVELDMDKIKIKYSSETVSTCDTNLENNFENNVIFEELSDYLDDANEVLAFNKFKDNLNKKNKYILELVAFAICDQLCFADSLTEKKLSTLIKFIEESDSGLIDIFNLMKETSSNKYKDFCDYDNDFVDRIKRIINY